MAVPYTFGSATSSIPLSQIDSNFATVITLGNTAIQLGNTVTTLNNMTLANVTISSGNITLTNVSATTANVTTANVVTMIVTGNETVQGNTTVTGTITGAKLIPTGSSASGNGMYLPATNSVGISTNGTNAVYIDSTQNVGIGTSSFVAKLTAATASASPSSVGSGTRFYETTNAYGLNIGANSSGYGWIQGLTGTTSTSGYNDIALQPNGGNLGIGTSSIPTVGSTTVLAVGNASGGTQAIVQSGSIVYRTSASTSGVDFYNPNASPMQWYIAGTSRMVLDASGNLLIGTTVSNAKLYVVASSGVVGRFEGASNATNPITQFITSDTTGNPYFAIYYTDYTSNRGSIQYNRGTGLMLYNTTSDYRAKDIVGPVTDSGAVIDSTPVYMGKMHGATQERPMFIAHKTPSYAHTGEKDAVDKDGNPVYQQMDASALIPVMWAEIQSLRKRLTALEST